MSLIKHIKQHIPEPKRGKVLQRFGTWMGVADPNTITPEMEQSPAFKNAIEGAANLMRNQAFDWIEQGESLRIITDRWKTEFISSHYNTAFGIRFSTTVPLAATFGFIEKGCNNRAIVHWIRYRFRPEGLFQPQYSNQTMDFVGALLYGLRTVKGRRCPMHCLKRLDLNRHEGVQRVLDGYVKDNDSVDDWEGSDDEENERVGYPRVAFTRDKSRS